VLVAEYNTQIKKTTILGGLSFLRWFLLKLIEASLREALVKYQSFSFREIRLDLITASLALKNF